MSLRSFQRRWLLHAVLAAALLTIAPDLTAFGPHRIAQAQAPAPSPAIAQGQAADWRVGFKCHTKTFLGCGDNDGRECRFGGEPQAYDFSQQFVYASSADKHLQKGQGCAGATPSDPLGATFASIYDNDFYFIIWNDQFYGDPPIHGCGDSC